MLKGIIFDMDDTLYTSNSLRNAYREAAITLLIETKGIGIDSAVAVYQEIKNSIEIECGYIPTNWMIMHRIGFSWEDWVRQSVECVDPKKFLKPDPNLLKVLKCLKIDFKLGILTNNNRIQTERILEALSIKDLFDAILTLSETGITKPNSILCKKIAASLGCSPDECLMVGDNPGIDLEPAEKNGMKTLYIRDVTEIYLIDKKTFSRII